MFTLAERDIRAQYKQATLGLLWALIASGTVTMRKVDGYQTLHIPPREDLKLAA